MKKIIFVFCVLTAVALFFVQHDKEKGKAEHIIVADYEVESGESFQDLFLWCNRRINVRRFVCPLGANDTVVNIPLVDSARGRFFVHPHFGRVNSRFGQRRLFGRQRWHHGTDIRGRVGDTVRVAFDGIVRVIQYDPEGFGNVVVVRHSDGMLETLYAHLSRIFVESNQSVKAGDVIGLVGNTGRTTAPHLHFEIRYLGVPFNPEHIIDFANSRLMSGTLVITKANFVHLSSGIASTAPAQLRSRPKKEEHHSQAIIASPSVPDETTNMQNVQPASRQEFEIRAMSVREEFEERQRRLREEFETRERESRQRFEMQRQETREKLEAQNRKARE